MWGSERQLPDTKLTVAGSLGIWDDASQHGNARISTVNGSSGPYGGQIVFSPQWYNGNSYSFVERMRIQDNGNVGIGTTTPDTNLTVAGSVGIWDDGAQHGNARISTVNGSSGPYGGQILFSPQWYNGSSYSFVERMRIQDNGNVGIGTTTPAAKLDVNGTANVSGSLTATSFSGNGANLTNVNATALSCTGCVAGSAIASGAITGANVSTTAGISPTAILGTAATLGSNTLTGDQTITGNLNVSANQTVAGNLSIAGTVNGWIITPVKTGSCTLNGTTYPTCISANGLAGFTALVPPPHGPAVLQAHGIKSGVGRGSSMEAPATGGNTIADGVVGGTISGGGGLTTDSGGTSTSYANLVTNNGGTVGGGALNQAGDATGPTSTSCCETVSGGLSNTASGDLATIAGGYNNTASFTCATVAGGHQNTASGYSSTVAGGYLSAASGRVSFAAGSCANAVNAGAFVWNGGPGIFDVGTQSCASQAIISSSAAEQFVVNASGGFWLGSLASGTVTATQPAGDFLYTTTGAVLTTSGVWTNKSDQNLKTAFEPLDESSLLARVGRLPITSWQYRADPSSIRHIGPMAQDFYSAFRLGNDDKHIDTVDEGGVALAGVQALYRLSLKKDSEIQTLRSEVQQLRARESELTRQVRTLEEVQRHMATMEARLAQVEARTLKPRPKSVKRSAPGKPVPESVKLAEVQF